MMRDVGNRERVERVCSTLSYLNLVGSIKNFVQ